MLPRRRKSATKRSSPGGSSMPAAGEDRSRRADGARYRNRRPQNPSRRIVGISLSVTPVKPVYIPLAHCGPGVAEQLPRDEVLARLKPWLEAAVRPSTCQNANTTSTFLPITTSRSPASPTIRCCKATSLNPTRATISASCAAATWAGNHCLQDLCGKGSTRIGFGLGRYPARRDLRRRRCRRDPARASHLHPRFASEPGLSRILAIELPVRQVIWRIERWRH